MSTLKEYFQNDFKGLHYATTVKVKLDVMHKVTEEKTNLDFEVPLRLNQHIETSTRYFTFYVPPTPFTLAVCKTLLQDLEKFLELPNSITAIGKFMSDVTIGIHQMHLANSIYIYTETLLSESEIKELDAIAKSKSLYITIRSTDYLAQKMAIEKPLAFISHDSRDKDLIARPLAVGLNSRLCFTWYDEFSLKIGASLRESIEKGIKEAKKCILILTPNYFSNPGWTKTEFNSIFTREMIKQEKVVLPIWHGVSKTDVYEYSPSLADTFALTWITKENKSEEEYNQEIEKLYSKLHTAIVG